MSSIGQPYLLTVTDVERGIMALAAKLIGNADEWTTLVTVNQLAPPYLSLYPSQAYGPPAATLTLSQSVSAGPDALSLAGQPLSINLAYFSYSGSNGLVAEAISITNYDGSTITFATPLQNTYPAGVTLQLFASYNVGNLAVLLPGQTIFVPVSGTNSLTLNTNAILTDVFGSDFTLPFAFDSGDLSNVNGLATFNQRINVAIQTELTSLPLYQDFGSELNANLGASSTSVKWTAFVREALMKLPEVDNVTNLQVTASGTNLSVSGFVWAATSNTPIQLINESFTIAA